MPEVWFDIVWPDGKAERCYSPSLVVKEKLSEGQDYPLDEFMARSRDALAEASARVQQKFGFPCSRAHAQMARLEQSAAAYTATPDAIVRVRCFLDETP